MNPALYDPIAKLLGEWASSVCVASALLRLSLALVLAAVIGCERATKRHAAGLRTFILVTISSAIAMILDLAIIEQTPVHLPLLSAAAVIGIAMISGNCILFSSRGQIKGLTTSAGLWCCGLLGLLSGAGMYLTAILVGGALLLILALFPRLEIYLKNRSGHFEIHLELKNKTDLGEFVTTLRRLGLRIDDIESNAAYIGSGLSVYTVTLTLLSPELKKYKTHAQIIQALSTLDYIAHIEEMT